MARRAAHGALRRAHRRFQPGEGVGVQVAGLRLSGKPQRPSQCQFGHETLVLGFVLIAPAAVCPGQHCAVRGAGGRLPHAATVGQRFLRSVLPDDQEERRRTSSPALARANPCPSGSGARNGGSVCGYRDFFATPAGTAVPGTTRRQPRRTVYLYIAVLGVNARSCRRQGLPGRNGTGTSVRRCMPDGVRHPDGEADRRSRAKDERRERRAGRYSCRRRPGRGSGPETGTSPGSSACLAPPADGHAGERRGRADRHCAAVNGCPKRPSPYPASR